jgi:hypothetical protein
MVDVLLYSTAIISAIISYLTGLIFFVSYVKDKKINRLIWGIAFILYAIGHTIMGVIAGIDLSLSNPSAFLIFMWIYVNLGGAGTTGLILYSTFPFFTEKSKIRELITGIFVAFYTGGSALFAFVLPDENPLAIINPTTHSQLGNMSWWVVELLIPASFFIGIIFLRHYKISGTTWGLLIGLSFIIYAIILFVWPIPELKPLFYIVRTISVGFLSLGGIMLARE